MDSFCLRSLLFVFMIQFWDLQCASGTYVWLINDDSLVALRFGTQQGIQIIMM